jgi:hypothetical protein
MAIEEGIDFTRGKPLGDRHLQGSSARLDPQRDPRRTIVLANGQRHEAASDVERSRFWRRRLSNGSACFGKKRKHGTVLYDSVENPPKKNRHREMPVVRIVTATASGIPQPGHCHRA